MKLTRAFLIGVIVSLSLAALLGIGTFLVSHNPDWKLITSMLSICLFSLTSLGASLVLSKGVWRVPMAAAMAISGLGLVLYLAVIWGNTNLGSEELLLKAMGLAAVWAIVLPHAGLLGLTQFTGALRVVRIGAIAAVLLLAGMITLSILGEVEQELWYRGMGALAILVGLGTISLPILHKIRGIDRKSQVVTTALELQIVCPRCRKTQIVPAGISRCCNCKLKFTIDIEEPRCPNCNYLLYRLTSPRCPECGQPIGTEEIAPDSAPTPPQ